MTKESDNLFLWIDACDIFPGYATYLVETYSHLYFKALDFAGDHLWQDASPRDFHRFALGYLQGCLKHTDMMTFKEH